MVHLHHEARRRVIREAEDLYEYLDHYLHGCDGVIPDHNIPGTLR
jgi:hypothetical protein